MAAATPGSSPRVRTACRPRPASTSHQGRGDADGPHRLAGLEEGCHEGPHLRPHLGRGSIQGEGAQVAGHPHPAGQQQGVELGRIGLGQIQALADPGDAAGLGEHVALGPGRRGAQGVVHDLMLGGVRRQALEGRPVLVQGQQCEHRLAHLGAVQMAATGEEHRDVGQMGHGSLLRILAIMA
jgi:hypothetical protein